MKHAHIISSAALSLLLVVGVGRAYVSYVEADARASSSEGVEPDVELTPAVDAPFDHVDPRHEGQKIRVRGRLDHIGALKDPLTGLSVEDSLGLSRTIQVYAWKRSRRKSCLRLPDGSYAPQVPRYDIGWTSTPVDPVTFDTSEIAREQRYTPEELSFEAPEFPADPEYSASPARVRFGAYNIEEYNFSPPRNHCDPSRVLQRAFKHMRAEDLEPTLLARFPEAEIVDGFIYLHGYRARPELGHMRIVYRVSSCVHPGVFTVEGYQRGEEIWPGISSEEHVEMMERDDPRYEDFGVDIIPERLPLDDDS